MMAHFCEETSSSVQVHGSLVALQASLTCVCRCMGTGVKRDPIGFQLPHTSEE